MKKGDKVRLTATGVAYLHSAGVTDATTATTGLVSDNGGDCGAVRFDGLSRPQYAEGEDWWMTDDEVEVMTTEASDAETA